MDLPEQPSLDDQRHFWDWHWKNWAERKAINDWKDRRHDLILDLVRGLPLSRPRILDLGCGPGWYTVRLSQFGETVGVDLSEEAIEMARARFPGVVFLCGNLYDVALPAEHFDVVVSQEVFDHVEDQERFLGRAASLLKGEGYLILSCANRFVIERLSSFERQPSGHIGRYSTARELRRILASRFKVLRLHSIIPMGDRGVLRWLNSGKLNAVAAFLAGRNRVERLKELAGLGYTLILLAQKSGAGSSGKA